MSRQYTNTLLFEAFEEALKHLIEDDAQLFTWPKAKVSIAHTFSMHLHRTLCKVLGLSLDTSSTSYLSLPQKMKVDLFALAKTSKADILLHDREKNRPLAILFNQDYLSKQQIEVLHKLEKEGCSLVLGVAFLHQKDYILIYRANGEKLDYYHFSRAGHTSSLLKQREVPSAESPLQLSLNIQNKKKRKKKQAPPSISEDQ
ncbi:MAG TPA: hypothetical protein VJ863_02115 [Sphaerochaeta sp.]|nr:hypothetical protein [Sphaerochaeta sp.]